MKTNKNEQTLNTNYSENGELTIIINGHSYSLLDLLQMESVPVKDSIYGDVEEIILPTESE